MKNTIVYTDPRFSVREVLSMRILTPHVEQAIVLAMTAVDAKEFPAAWKKPKLEDVKISFSVLKPMRYSFHKLDVDSETVKYVRCLVDWETKEIVAIEIPIKGSPLMIEAFNTALAQLYVEMPIRVVRI